MIEPKKSQAYGQKESLDVPETGMDGWFKEKPGLHKPFYLINHICYIVLKKIANICHVLDFINRGNILPFAISLCEADQKIQILWKQIIYQTHWVTKTAS